MYPNGPADVNAFEQAGGVPGLMRRLAEADLRIKECRDRGVPLVLASPSAGPDGPPGLPTWRIDADPAELWRQIGPDPAPAAP